MIDERHREEEPSRALVVVNEPSRFARLQVPRPLATFVTQVVACEARAPAYRKSRRAEPPEASAVYENAAGPGQGSRFQRIL